MCFLLTGGLTKSDISKVRHVSAVQPFVIRQMPAMVFNVSNTLSVTRYILRKVYYDIANRITTVIEIKDNYGNIYCN